MKLSVVIVSYNVRYFLEQCLRSALHAARATDTEIWVVDNNSADGSADMVREQFPQVRLIANSDNPGFAKANNQAIRQCTGEHILLLNPDTLVEEDTFTRILNFMAEHPDAGGLGVYMIDGRGRYLPESKRSLPTPAVSFYKISGLSRLFPKSKKFGRYHLGFLDRDQVHKVEVLSGAFMLLRAETLEKTGLLDEDYFMYGEDIDLSYRILKAGYHNYYFPGTRIIHYKGESTRKSSVNYVLVFYNAMRIFARKHFSAGNAGILNVLITLAIYGRAGMALVARFFKAMFLPLCDAVILYAGLSFLRFYWEHYVKAEEGLHFATEVQTIAFPLFILVWIASLGVAGGYEPPVKLARILRAVVSGSALILLGYALLPEELRFSRALVLLGSAWAITALPLLRILLSQAGLRSASLEQKTVKKVAVAGSEEEFQRVRGLLMQSAVPATVVGRISPEGRQDLRDAIGPMERMQDLISLYRLDEVIFCARDIPSQEIISHMSIQADQRVEFKIAPPESLYIIGSNSINTQGELYGIPINSINRPVNRRNKRMFDLTTALLITVTLPLQLLFVPGRGGLLRNLWMVWTSRFSWVGYAYTGDQEVMKLPSLRPGVLTPADNLQAGVTDTRTAGRLNQIYAKDYHWQSDLDLLLRNYHKLGRYTGAGGAILASGER